MSVKVDLDRLAETLADFAFGYLITVGDDYRAHTVSVVPQLADGVLDIGPIGNTTRRNASQHSAVTVTWPPREPGGYTLIVDGRAELSDTAMSVVPTRAVLHRPAGPDFPTPTTGCLHDCVPLDAPAPTALTGGHINDMVVDAQGRAYVGNFGFDLMGGAPVRNTTIVRVDPDGATRVVADRAVADIDLVKSFYTDYLGLSTEEFNMGWVARYTSPGTGAVVQLVTQDASASQNPVTSVFVDDIDTAYAEAQRRGYEIVHPLTTEAWGVTRFFVRAPDGTVHNIVNHRD